MRYEKSAEKVNLWEMELNKKCVPLKPVCIGCLWEGDTGEGKKHSDDTSLLQQFRALVLTTDTLPEEASQLQSKKSHYLLKKYFTKLFMLTILLIFKSVMFWFNCHSTYEKSNTPFFYMLCLFCKRAYRGTKPGESFG